VGKHVRRRDRRDATTVEIWTWACLRLFVKVAEDALTSPALQTDFTLTMRSTSNTFETTFDEPLL